MFWVESFKYKSLSFVSNKIPVPSRSNFPIGLNTNCCFMNQSSNSSVPLGGLSQAELKFLGLLMAK